MLFLKGALVVVGASVVALLDGFMVVTDAVIEGPDVVELIDSVEVAVAEAVVVDIEDGLKGLNKVIWTRHCPDTPVKVRKQKFGFLIATFFG